MRYSGEEFGLKIPFVSFGAVTSDDLFCAKEAEIFRFYAENAGRYKRVLDIGANIGVHSLLMARNGWIVQAFEPDPETFEILKTNVQGHREIFPHQYAVSDHEGEETFVRVLNNKTGSHLQGDKEAYGPLERIAVKAWDCREFWPMCDFAKIDCEGHEARLLRTVPKDSKCEFMVEVGNVDNAQAIWEHFWPTDYKLYAQKRGWSPCRYLPDVPKHHSEGALFIGKSPPF